MKKLLIIIGFFSIVSNTSGQSKKVEKDLLQTELSIFWQGIKGAASTGLAPGLGLGLNLKYFIAPQHSLALEFNYTHDADNYSDIYRFEDSTKRLEELHFFYYHLSSLRYALSYRFHFGDRKRNIVHRLNSLGIFFGLEHFHYLGSSYFKSCKNGNCPDYTPKPKSIDPSSIYHLYLGLGYSRSFYINKMLGINIGLDWRIIYWSSLNSHENYLGYYDSFSYQGMVARNWISYGAFDIKIRLGFFFRVPDKKYKIYY